MQLSAYRFGWFLDALLLHSSHNVFNKHWKLTKPMLIIEAVWAYFTDILQLHLFTRIHLQIASSKIQLILYKIQTHFIHASYYIRIVIQALHDSQVCSQLVNSFVSSHWIKFPVVHLEGEETKKEEYTHKLPEKMKYWGWILHYH